MFIFEPSCEICQNKNSQNFGKSPPDPGQTWQTCRCLDCTQSSVNLKSVFDADSTPGWPCLNLSLSLGLPWVSENDRRFLFYLVEGCCEKWMQFGYINLWFVSCGGLCYWNHDFPQPCGANVGASRREWMSWGKWHARCQEDMDDHVRQYMYDLTQNANFLEGINQSISFLPFCWSEVFSAVGSWKFAFVQGLVVWWVCGDSRCSRWMCCNVLGKQVM